VTVAEIARELGVCASTVKRDLRAPAPPRPSTTAPVVPLGHERTVKHGTQSERMLAPLREEHRGRLRQRFRQISEERLALIATLHARIDLGNAYCDENGIVRDHDAGELYPIVVQLDRWEARAEALLTRLEEAEVADPVDAITSIARELNAGDARDPEHDVRGDRGDHGVEVHHDGVEVRDDHRVHRGERG
jgi:hypothetical protein